MVVVKEEEEMVRKGPWTEQEDLQLVCFVGLFGERRWDFIAKVSGLNRTGKSCRLRWVNYLHPGLKRGRMTPQEERLVLDLHARWGNRWSRIARKLPGRTDNEIKNYWRTHMRKKAQETRKGNYSSSSPSHSSPASSCYHTSAPVQAEIEKDVTIGGGEAEDEALNWYSIEQIWNDIASSEMSTLTSDEDKVETCNLPSQVPTMMLPATPPWDCGCELMWRMNDEEEIKTFLPITDDLSVSNYQHGNAKVP